MSYIDRPATYTDHYELTMAQGYYLTGRHERGATFDYFFRKAPYSGSYVVFTGLDELLEILENYRFHEDELEWLKERGFDAGFLKFLESFRFEGTIHAVPEGEIVFPMEPLLRVDGTLLEAQLIETLLLNLLNFQSLVATKAARIRNVAGQKHLAEFGLRRSQGLGGIHAARAAIVGGFDSTSNLCAARRYGIPSTGTMAHSWIQTFESELEAFRNYADKFPDSCILLADTYDTLQSGLPNAIKVARELEDRGHRLLGIRLDSGDLSYFSKQVRTILDREGLQYVKIAVSNQLDEVVINSLQSQNAPIDLYGVGTRLVTGQGEASLGGVYKIARIGNRDTFKKSDNVEKMSLPGSKEIYRYFTPDNMFVADAIALTGENPPEQISHPFITHMSSDLRPYRSKQLLRPVMKDGKRNSPSRSLEEISSYRKERTKQLDSSHKRLENPHIYKVGVSSQLLKLRNNLMERMRYREEESS